MLLIDGGAGDLSYSTGYDVGCDRDGSGNVREEKKKPGVPMGPRPMLVRPTRIPTTKPQPIIAGSGNVM